MGERICIDILSDFINLTQVHNNTVSAHAIFAFGRISVSSTRFTGIKHVMLYVSRQVRRFLESSGNQHCETAAKNRCANKLNSIIKEVLN